MAIKINGQTVVNDDKKGLFKQVNPGTYTTAERDALTAATGDIIYNSDGSRLELWDGTQWTGITGDTTEVAGIINNVTLTENDPGDDRFTSQSFDVDIEMLREGNPFTEKSLKGEVTASFDVYPKTDSISSNTVVAWPNTSKTQFTESWTGLLSPRVYAPDNLGRWKWYTFTHDTNNLNLRISGPGESINGGTTVATVSSGSISQGAKTYYFPPTTNDQFHTIVAYQARVDIGSQWAYFRRPADGSTDWAYYNSSNDKGLPLWDENTGYWYWASYVSGILYLKKSASMHSVSTADLDTSTGITSASTSGSGGVAVGNNKAVIIYRNSSTGNSYVRSYDVADFTTYTETQITTFNDQANYFVFANGYFWVSYTSNIYRSSDGINWTDVSHSDPTENAVTSSYLDYDPINNVFRSFATRESNNTLVGNTMWTSNNAGATWVAAFRNDWNNSTERAEYVTIGGDKILFWGNYSTYYLEFSYPYNEQTLTLSGTGSDYSSFNVDDVIRPANSTGQEYTGVIKSISGTTIEVVSDYIYQSGDIIESVYPTGTQISTRYLVISNSGAVTNTTSIDPGFVAVGSNTSQTITFPATFLSGDTPDVELPTGTSLVVNVQTSNILGSDTFQSNSIVPIEGAVITKPVITAPVQDPSGTATPRQMPTMTFVSSDFEVNRSNFVKVSATWEVSTDLAFTSPMIDTKAYATGNQTLSETDRSNITLDTTQNYFVRVKYNGTFNGTDVSSAYSDVIEFRLNVQPTATFGSFSDGNWQFYDETGNQVNLSGMNGSTLTSYWNEQNYQQNKQFIYADTSNPPGNRKGFSVTAGNAGPLNDSWVINLTNSANTILAFGITGRSTANGLWEIEYEFDINNVLKDDGQGGTTSATSGTDFIITDDRIEYDGAASTHSDIITVRFFTNITQIPFTTRKNGSQSVTANWTWWRIQDLAGNDLFPQFN